MLIRACAIHGLQGVREVEWMHRRQRQIMARLGSEDRWVRGADLAEELGVSLRTVQTDIRRINEWLGVPHIESNTRLGYRLSPEGKRSAMAIQALADAPRYGVGHNLLDGQIIMMLLFEKDWLSTDEIARRLFVSRSTVHAHLEAVRRIVPRTGNAILSAEAGKGLRIVADERECRLMCMKLLETSFEEKVFFGIGAFRGLRGDVEVVRRLLVEVFADCPVWYTSPAFAMLVNLIIISIMRSSFGFSLSDVDGCNRDPFVRAIADAVFQAFGYRFSRAEEHELLLQLQSMSLMERARSVQLTSAATECEACEHVGAFADAVRELAGIDLTFDDVFARAFERHIERMLRRLESGMIYRGGETARVVGEHPLSVHLLRTCLQLPLHAPIPDAEIEYLVPYVSHALEQGAPKLAILFVTDESAGIALEIQGTLAHYAEEAGATVQTIPSYMFERYNEADARNFDLIVTTDPALALQHAHVVALGNMADRRSRDALRQQVLRAREDADARAREVLRGAFPVCELPAAMLEALSGADADRCEDALRELLGKYGVGAITLLSIDAVGPSHVTIVACGGRASCVQHGACDPFVWKGKRIKDVALIRFAADVEPVSFFRYAHDELRMRANTCERVNAC